MMTADEIIEEGCIQVAEKLRFSFEAMRGGCGSPIEEMFLAALLWDAATGLSHINIQFFGGDFTFGQPHVFPGASLDVWMQARVGNYRADFLLDHMTDAGQRKIVVVECDGHDFHDRTKEQARHDRQRDRFMASLGIVCLRFTGSEIFADAMKCAAEALSQSLEISGVQ